ncbi:hypothetical protein BG004_004443 [Podila humilis]|nr:hypothetical protein BG004_004443 [Podila humilis]
MADYLYHYVEHDHPHLVRQLSFIFPSIPRQVFDELSPMTLSSSSTMPLSSSPRSSSASSNHTVLNLFQSFQQPQKNARTIEVAQATRTKIEQDLLLHAPQQIKTLCISAPRFHTILRVIQAEEEERAKQPQTPKVARQQPWEMKEPLHRQSPTSSFTSLLSFLSSSSPFSASTLPSSISSTSSWSSASSSVSLTSPSTSAQSSRTSTISGTTSTASLHSWRGTPRISCKLSRLTRLELLDVHFRFDIDAIIEFLKTHDHVYGTICEIKVGGPDDLGRSTPPGLIRILQSLKTVKVLDMTDWREAIKYLDMIPTKHLETLLLGNVRMTTLNSSGSVINGEVTAQTLEDLAHALEGLVPTAAATASASTSGIQSMNNNDQEGASDSNREDPQIRTLQSCRQLKELRMPVLVDGLFEWAVRERHQSQRIARRWEDHVDPVQIQVVHLSGSNTGPLVPTLVHVADAFRASLQTLQSTSWSDMAETLSSCQSLSWNWSLPQLQVLDLQGEVACRLKVQAVVEYCPALRVLRLSLPHSVLPSSASSFVTAVGTAATISIRDEHTQAGQDEGLGHVDDSEAHGYVSWRYASLANLFTPRGTKNNQRQGCCAITLPKLQELSIAGDWGLDNSSLLGMAEVVPGLTRLSLLRCEGVSVGGLVDAMSLLKSLRWLEVNRGWHSELQQAANAIADNSMNDKIEVSSK